MGVFGGKEEAVRALWSLSVVNNELKYAIGQQGGLQPLVEMLYTGKESFRDEVVGLLWSLAMHDGNLESIIDVGAASGLVKVLHTGACWRAQVVRDIRVAIDGLAINPEQRQIATVRSFAELYRIC